MPDEMEQIEARLAAYIDGTLPAAQPAEIEAYLKANPAHAKLISELVSLRSAVSSLPREKPPAEVLDTLQAQIERHALLDEDDAGEPSMRITRWPAFGSAAAAVLLLAAGLGLLVYQVLPKPKSNEIALLSASRPGEVSLSDAIPAPAEKFAVSALRETTVSSDAIARRRAATGPALLAGAIAPDAAASPVVVESMSPEQRLAQNANPAEFATAQQNNFANSNLGQNAPASAAAAAAALGRPGTFFASINAASVVSNPVRVVIVRSDDPALTQNLLVGSLVADKTPFEIVDWPGGPEAGPPSTLPSVNELVSRLHSNGDLKPDDGVVARTRPVIVRGVGVDRAYALRDTLDGQRPGRQTAAWAGRDRAKASRSDTGQMADADRAEAASKPAGTRAGVPADVGTPPATMTAPPATTSPDDATPRMSEIRSEPRTSVLFDVRPQASQPPTSQPTVSQPTTSPASQPAEESSVASDLVVLVLARPTPTTAPATQPTPATTQP